MIESEIEDAILCSLYEARSQPDGRSDMKVLARNGQWNENIFWSTVRRMARHNLIYPYGGSTYVASGWGVIEAERKGLVPESVVKQQNQLRMLILDVLATVYDEHGDYYIIPISRICEKAGLQEKDSLDNIQLLLDIGYTKLEGNACFKITDRGLDKVREWRKHRAIADEFESITRLTPQSRGRAFQKFIAAMLGQQGWSQLEGVRTSHEEMDVIINQGREYFLIECKWEKDAIESGVIRELIGKLTNRVDVKGIVISMSGFTSGAIEQIEKYVTTRMIMLFGPEDVRQMAYAETTFTMLLDHKYKELVTHNKAIFS